MAQDFTGEVSATVLQVTLVTTKRRGTVVRNLSSCPDGLQFKPLLDYQYSENLGDRSFCC